jgi:hypothetical protein
MAGRLRALLQRISLGSRRPPGHPWSENLCLPPTPVVLSDLVFFDHFLPRDPSPKFDAVIPALRALRSRA